MIDAGPLHHEPASVRPHADETQVWRKGVVGERAGRARRRRDPRQEGPEPNLGLLLLLLLFCWRGGVWEASPAGGG